MKENIPKRFGTSGIREKVGIGITLELVTEVGLAVSTYIDGHGKVVLGYDTRTSSEMLSSAITAGILMGGGDVLMLGMVPTPVVGYATVKLGADSGVMITASHNPPEYNGIKLWNPNGMAYTPDQEIIIEKIINTRSFTQASWKNIGRIEDVSGITSSYVRDVLSMVNIEPGLKVVVDCANGAASFISPLVLRKAGCKVLTLNCQPDGFFPGRMPEPSPQNLVELMKVVRTTKSDLGIAHDGDADRMVAVDEKGNMADFDKLLALVCGERGGKVVTTVDASMCVDERMKDFKGVVLRTKVGDVHVAQKIKEEDASFGGEPSGTWLHPDFCMCPDGILSALRVVELVGKYGPLSRLLDEIPSYPTLRDKIICNEFQKEIVMKDVKEKLPEKFDQVVDVNFTDGVKICMEDGSWVLIRPSGTESYIRITLEAKNSQKAYEIREVCREFIGRIL